MSRSRYLIDPYVQAIFVELERIKASSSDPVQLAAVERAESIVSERAEVIRAAYARSSDLTRKAWEILRDSPEQIGSFTVPDLIVRLRDQETHRAKLEAQNTQLEAEVEKLTARWKFCCEDRTAILANLKKLKAENAMLRERLGRKDGDQ